MSAVNAQADAASKSASKNKKKKGKKKPNGQANASNSAVQANGSHADSVADDDDDEGRSRSQSPSKASKAAPVEAAKSTDMPPAQSKPSEKQAELPVRNGSHRPTETPAENEGDDDADDEDDEDEEQPETTTTTTSGAATNTTARLDAMQQERDSLRAEVTELRKSLESLQEKHNEELSGVKEELEQSNEGKEHAETQYRNLLGKVNTIRSQLGERLKADAAELETARERIEELEKTNSTAQSESERLQKQIFELNTNLESQASEIETLRSRTNLSTSNWAKERDDMVQREAALREDYEVARQAMQDWEILATEERSRREALEEKSQELEDQLNSQREAYERIQSEANTQSSTVDGLQRALRDLQEERKRELREMVEQSQSQLDALRAQTKAAEEAAATLKSELETTQAELARAAPFEKEVKEKNLLIGKLRHEAVILNDHLTKALRFLKRGKPEDNVDRQLVTNHFLHFLALDRSDPKKFQILQLIAALLGWDESQKEQAGLQRAGSTLSTAGGSLRVPVSPFRRTPSTPTLGEFVPESPGGASRESLAELWSDFLEREAQAGGAPSSRRPSIASSRGGIRSPSVGGLMSPSSESGKPGPFSGGSLRGVPEGHKRKESQSTIPASGKAAEGGSLTK
ncbi:putative GRIP domain-containing protein [Septoria linicola]|nr:putative GRIP domain-containing protein [Septoria linicola]